MCDGRGSCGVMVRGERTVDSGGVCPLFGVFVSLRVVGRRMSESDAFRGWVMREVLLVDEVGLAGVPVPAEVCQSGVQEVVGVFGIS